MDDNLIGKLTSYSDINCLLIDWVRGVKDDLGDNIVGLYLSGSLAYGDFVTDRSDIDLQAVVKKPLLKGELELIESLHKKIDERYPAWANRTECSYVPLEVVREILPPKTPRPWWGFDTLHKTALAGNEWIVNHYFLSKYGIALYGPEFKTLVPNINIEDVRKASARDLFKEWEPKIDDKEWLSNSHYQSYLVLNLCRILCTVVGGRPASKKVAAKWAKETYLQWRNLIEEAERWKYGMKMNRNNDVGAFIEFAVEKVNETGILK